MNTAGPLWNLLVWRARPILKDTACSRYKIYKLRIFSVVWSTFLLSFGYSFLAPAAQLPLLQMNFLIILESSKRRIQQNFGVCLLGSPWKGWTTLYKVFIWFIFISVKWETLDSSLVETLGQSRVRQRSLLSAYNFWLSYKRERERKWRKPGVENSCVSLLAGAQSK